MTETYIVKYLGLADDKESTVRGVKMCFLMELGFEIHKIEEILTSPNSIIKETDSKDDAQNILDLLTKAGAKIEILDPSLSKTESQETAFNSVDSIEEENMALAQATLDEQITKETRGPQNSLKESLVSLEDSDNPIQDEKNSQAEEILFEFDLDELPTENKELKRKNETKVWELTPESETDTSNILSELGLELDEIEEPTQSTTSSKKTLEPENLKVDSLNTAPATSKNEAPINALSLDFDTLLTETPYAKEETKHSEKPQETKEEVTSSNALEFDIEPEKKTPEDKPQENKTTPENHTTDPSSLSLNFEDTEPLIDEPKKEQVKEEVAEQKISDLNLEPLAPEIEKQEIKKTPKIEETPKKDEQEKQQLESQTEISDKTPETKESTAAHNLMSKPLGQNENKTSNKDENNLLSTTSTDSIKIASGKKKRELSVIPMIIMGTICLYFINGIYIKSKKNPFEIPDVNTSITEDENKKNVPQDPSQVYQEPQIPETVRSWEILKEDIVYNVTCLYKQQELTGCGVSFLTPKPEDLSNKEIAEGKLPKLWLIKFDTDPVRLKEGKGCFPARASIEDNKKITKVSPLVCLEILNNVMPEGHVQTSLIFRITLNSEFTEELNIVDGSKTNIEESMFIERVSEKPTLKILKTFDLPVLEPETPVPTETETAVEE